MAATSDTDCTGVLDVELAPDPESRLVSRRGFLRRVGVVGVATGASLVLPSFVRGAGAPAVATDTIIGLSGTERGSKPTMTSIPFSMVGFELLDTDLIEFRTSVDGRDWTLWTEARRLGTVAEGADEGSRENSAAWRRATAPVWVGSAHWLQVRGPDPARVRAHLVDSAGLSRTIADRTTTRVLDGLVGAPAAAEAAPFRPQIISRASWGADESWRTGRPVYARAARFAVIHHSATGSSYGRGDVPAILRGIYRYHTQTLGWQDLGYNFLVDRFGRVYEGRAGGVDRPVIGAHAAGHNDGAIGVAALGCFDGSCGSAPVSTTMLAGLDGLVSWTFGYHGVDPLGTTREGSRTIPTIVGHRDLGSTACPGGRLHDRVRGSDPMRERVLVRMFGFEDVRPSSTFATDIAWAAAAGITRGCNPPANDRFCPKEPVTREQMAAFIARALNLTDDRHPGFRDVRAGSTFDRDIRRIARAGITKGCGSDANGRFCPKDPVTREQMAAFLRRAVG